MKKRIVFYGVNYYPPKGGTSTVVENLILQLKDKYDLTVYCYRHHDSASHIAGVRTVQFRQLAKGSLGSFFYFFASAFHIFIFGKADLVHAHKTDCAIFLPLIRLRFKVVATSHEAPYKRDKWNIFQKAFFHLAERFFIRSANVCTSISRPLAEYYQQKYDREVCFIPNGINAVPEQAFDYQRAMAFLPPGISLKDQFILFSARRLMATKGAHTLLQALKSINYKGIVFIAGELNESAYLRELQNLAEGLRVTFLGFVNPLNALLALVKSAHLFVFPSETEGMSIMLLEVASTGTPIIASDIPENKQVFSDHEVLFFRTSDQENLAQIIKASLANDSMMAALGRSARQHVFTHYLWSDIALTYDRLYMQVISSR